MRKVRSQLAVLMDAHNLRVSQTGQGQRLSQRRLAELSGVHLPTINRLYHGRFERIDLSVIEKICEVLQCEIGDLLVLVEESSEG
jgi:putative transcriptional regulator